MRPMFACAPLFPRTLVRAHSRFAEDAVSEFRREDDAILEIDGHQMSVSTIHRNGPSLALAANPGCTRGSV